MRKKWDDKLLVEMPRSSIPLKFDQFGISVTQVSELDYCRMQVELLAKNPESHVDNIELIKGKESEDKIVPKQKIKVGKMIEKIKSGRPESFKFPIWTTHNDVLICGDRSIAVRAPCYDFLLLKEHRLV